MVRNTTKPNKITSQRTNFEFLITRRSQVQVLSPQPAKNGKTSSFTVLFLLQTAKKKSGNSFVTISENHAAQGVPRPDFGRVDDVGVTLGYGGGFVTDKGSCRHNVCTVRHKDGCHLMAEGVGGSGGENSGFPFAACPPCGSDTV